MQLSLLEFNLDTHMTASIIYRLQWEYLMKIFLIDI